MSEGPPAPPSSIVIRVEPTIGAYALALRRILVVAAGLAQVLFIVVAWTGLLELIGRIGPGPALGSIVPVWVLLVAGGACALVALVRHPARGEDDPEHVTLSPADHVGLLLIRAASLWYLAVLVFSAATAGNPALSPMQVTSGQVPLLGEYFPLALVVPILLRPAAARLATVLPMLVFAFGVAVSGPRDAATWDYAPYHYLFSAVYLAWATWTLHQARILDADRARTRVREAEAIRERAVTEGRRRSDAFIHDHVLSALVPAATGLADGALLVDAARVASATLDSVVEDIHPWLASQIAPAIGEYMGRIGLTPKVLAHLHADLMVPAEVAAALQEATWEALRNCLRHARGRTGALAPVTVTVTTTEQGLHIQVCDEGPGFDPAAIPDGRLGIRRSIIERVDSVGGRARVRSAPGEGAAVEISWRRRAVVPEDADRPAPVLPAGSGYSVQTPLARTMGALVGAFEVLLVVQCADAYERLWVVVAALALQGVAAWLCLREWPHAVLPRWAASVVALIAALSAVMVLAQLPGQGWPAWAPWSTATGSLLLAGVLNLRQRPAAAWVAWALRGVGTAAWAAWWGLPVGSTVMSLMAAQTLTLLSWTVATMWTWGVGRMIAEEQQRAYDLSQTRDAQREIRAVMDRSLVAVASRARPVLDAIAAEADGGALTEETRTRARLLEAELRDEIRAPALTGTAVVREARAARRRGIEVIMVDDSGEGGLADAALDRVVRLASAALHRAATGPVVIRIFPRGRPELATIVVDGTRVVVRAGADAAEKSRPTAPRQRTDSARTP